MREEPHLSGLILQPPMAGRVREVSYLREQLKRTSTGKGRLVFLVGEAGIGKTRLAEEFGQMAAQQGCQFLIGRCLPGSAHPYLPFQEALGKLIPKGTRRVKELGLPGWLSGPKTKHSEERRYRASQPWGASDSEDSYLGRIDARSLQATLELLRDATEKRPVYLLLEDLHWIDSASLQLLHFLARNSEELRVLTVGTYRSEEVATGEQGKTHPLLESLRLMRREGVCQEIRLDPLNLEELKLALEGMLDGKIDDQLLQRLETESEGNPLFAIETVRLLVETKRIVPLNGIWRAVAKHVELDMPATVREVILRRVDRLPRQERQILDCAAVVGDLFEPEVLRDALQIERLSLIETLASVERDHQLIHSEGRSFRFSHEKVRRAIYEEIPSHLRKELHRIVGQVLESGLPDESLYGGLSLNFCSAGETGKCLKYSLLAGLSLLRGLAAPEAASYFETTIETAKDEPSFVEERQQALEGLGDAQSEIGLPESAIISYNSFLELCSNSKDKARVLRKSAEILWGAGSGSQLSARVTALLDDAERCPSIDQIEAGRIKRVRSKVAASTGKFLEAERLYSEAERLFDEAGVTQEVAQTLLEWSSLYLTLGRAREASEKLEEASQFYEKAQSSARYLDYLITSGMCYLHLGLEKEAVERFTRLGEIAAKFGLYNASVMAHWCNSLVYWSREDLELARPESQKARDFAMFGEDPYAVPWSELLLAHIEISQKRINEGERLLQDAAERFESPKLLRVNESFGAVEEAGRPYATGREQAFLAHSLWVQAELLAAKGEWTASREKWRQAIKHWLGVAVYGFLVGNWCRVYFAKHCLLPRRLEAEAREQLLLAVEAFERLGNKSWAEGARKLLAGLA